MDGNQSSEKNKKSKGLYVVFFAVAVIVAIVIAFTCVMYVDLSLPTMPTNDVESDSINPSSTYNDKTGNLSSGILTNGDILNYNYTGSVVSVTLPRGTYTLEVWGAQGGSLSSTNDTGGLGGYSKASFVITASTTIYIVVGSQPTTQSGGYNGGGTGGSGAAGMGGGGATHIANATGVLKNVSSGNVIIVAGGGGGAGNNSSDTANGGKGGGLSGGDDEYTGGGTHGSGGYGGTQNAGGAHGDRQSYSTVGTNGSYGQGGNSSIGGSNGGGGGGGGWYGGGGGDFGSGCATGGGGGSGYINTGLATATTESGFTSGMQNGVQSGNGKARITVVNVNQAPASTGYTVSGRVRGSSGTTTVKVSTLATDPDATKTTLYFTDGNSGNYDTFTRTSNTRLYLDSGCSVAATDYLDWNWGSDNQTLNITAYKRYPRNGVYSSKEGRLTVYVRVRDSFGTSTTRGVGVVVFYVQFAVNTTSTLSVNNISTTINGKTMNYVLGSSTTATAPSGNYTPATGNIYNPKGAGRYTAIMPEPVKMNNSFIIRASDLLSGVCGYDQVLMALNDTSGIEKSVGSRKYKIDEYDAGSSTTAFNASKGAIAKAFTQLTFTCLSPSPGYQAFTVTLYVVEKTTAYGSSYPNTVPGMSAVTMDIVFSMQNSRPTVSTSASNVVDVAVGETRSLALGNYFTDADGAITSTTHTITGVVVPENEYIQLNASGDVVAMSSGVNANFYNIGNKTSETFETSGQGDTATGLSAGIVHNLTDPTKNAGGNGTREAYMRFSYANDVLTVTGLRSSWTQYKQGRATKPGHFYILLHVQDKRDAADNGIWLPLAFRIGNSGTYAPASTTSAINALTEQASEGEMPTASGSVGDEYYFSPMGIGYGGKKVIGKYMKNGALTSDGLQALAYDGDNYTTESGAGARNGKLNELLRLSSGTSAESVVKSVSDAGYTGSGASAENRYIQVEEIDIYIEKALFADNAFGGYASGGRVMGGSGTNDAANGQYYAGLAGTETTVGGIAYYTVRGIKITLRSATMNRYVYASASVTDVTGKTSAAIDIAIRVNNSAPESETDASKVAAFGNKQTDESYSTYENKGLPTYTYKIPLGGSFILTPYDFVNDYNMTRFGATVPSGGFTLNGLSGVYDPATGTLSTSDGKTESNKAFDGLYGSAYGDTTYTTALSAMLSALNARATVKKVSAGVTGTAAGSATTSNASMPTDRLYFARSSDGASDAYTYAPTGYADISAMATDATGFVSYAFGNKLKLGQTTFDVDYIIVTSVSRTTRPASIDLTVRDRYGDSADGAATLAVRIVIDVINTPPAVKDEYRSQELAVTAVGEDGKVTPTTATFSSNGNGSATGLMTDLDGDVPEFILSAGVVVTNSKGLAAIMTRHPKSFDEIAGNIALFTDDGTAQGRLLTEYVTASLASRYELNVTAKSSTKAIASGVYVCYIADDGNGGSSVGYVQIEVINTSPRFNTTGETGFDRTDPVWTVKTTSNADITRDRYIVGSTVAKDKIKELRGATDSDVKIIATDEDALHGELVLSPRVTTETGYDYVNLVHAGTGVVSDAEYAAAVPRVATSTEYGADVAGAAAIVFMRTSDDGKITDSAVLPTGFTAEILYLVNDEWITRDALIAQELSGKTLSEASEYFDAQGRFVYTGWAFRMHATEGFDGNMRIGITLSVRDRAELGGDTAGAHTAWATDRRQGNTDVTGAITATVFHSISRTGIRTKDEYERGYNGYYAVEYKANGNSAVASYVPTYDGDKTSAYGAGLTDITYDVVQNNNWLRYDGTGEETLKSRAQGEADGTNAGTNAGVTYDAGAVGGVTGAYKYPTVIEVPADGNAVYVPMSYFGLLQSLVAGADDDGTFRYPSEYVGYDVGNDKVHARGNINDVAKAIRLTDGNTVWTGSTLNDNPYIKIEAFDVYKADGSASSAAYFESESSKPYYNNRLSVVTVDGDGMLTGYEKSEANRKSFIGDGRLMYLEDQAQKLQEHNFGLTFEKTRMRTGVNDLTLTVELAKSEGGRNTVEDEAADKQTVTVSIRIANNKLELAPDVEGNEQTGTKYDESKGTYYVDLTMSSASSQTYVLSRRDENGKTETQTGEYADAARIAYSDADYEPGTAYRDRAYFHADSFNRLSSWARGESAYGRALETDGAALSNTNASERAQRSVLNYFGVKTAAELAGIDGDYQPNPGMYGSNQYRGGTDGYSSYFNASLTDAGRVLNITASRKTTINAVALRKELGASYTQAQVKELYAKRGLVATYADASVDPSMPTRVYYPFKALIYDSCGAGFSGGSYVGIEIRITVTNADPTLKTVGEEVTDNAGKVIGREYGVNLAVGNSVTVNLYDIVSDTDMYVLQTGNNYALATRADFESRATGLDLEAGDYLDSPFAHDPYLTGERTYDKTNAVEKADGTYYRNGGGLTAMPSGGTESDRDVTMWMETTGGQGVSAASVPSTNNLSFTVNRRTVATVGGKSVAIDEYRFVMRFYDSFECATLEFTFIIHITNKAPVITAEDRSFTMYSGDDLTVMAAYYDEFTGEADGGAAAYANSATRKTYEAYRAVIGSDRDKNGDGRNNATGRGYWLYPDVTSEKKSELIHDATTDRDGGAKKHLGYMGLASDDTPWKMRIANVQYYSGQGARLWVENTNLMLDAESATDTQRYALAVTIRAVSACVDEPVTVTIIDGDGGTVTTTLYITVISSPPVALDYTDASDKLLVDAAGLEGETSGGEYVPGTFRLFTTPGKAGTVSVDGMEAPKTARRVYEIPMTAVAKDPDSSDETSNMALYGDGSFTVNGVPLTRENDGAYRAEYFELRIGAGARSFTLTATGFDPETTTGYEELKFRIADYGNGDYANTLEITLHVYTLYSDMTNTRVANKTQTEYAEYLSGGDAVRVKSYDAYYGADRSESSVYAQVRLDGNTGNDGNTESPVVDPDVSAIGKQSYTTRLYAFIRYTENGVWEGLDSTTLGGMFERNAEKGTFALKAGVSYGEYLIGGITYDGAEITAGSAATARLNAVTGYAEFAFENNGAAISFVPKASTLNNTGILLYAETEKHVASSRACSRPDAVLRAGALFRLDVEDSAPTAVTDAGMPDGIDWAASGKKGDKLTFKIHDAENPFGALFTDSDRGDKVTVTGFGSDADYEKALKKAMDADSTLDWRASEGKPRAITVEVNAQTSELEITVNRRMDRYIGGRYAESVSFPLEIEGRDAAGKTATVTIQITVNNSGVSVRNEVEDKFDPETGVGYTFGKAEDGNYEINARIKYSHALELDLNDFMTDPDYASATVDGDSYTFAGSTRNVYPYAYLGDETQNVFWYDTYNDGSINPDKSIRLATVEPLGTDKWHRTGIRITAVDTTRTLTARTYIRIADRSGDTSNADYGTYVTLNITVMNDSPYVKQGQEVTSVTMIGSDNSTPESMLFFIGDFVADNNGSDVTGDAASAASETYLRIFSQQPGTVQALYSTKYALDATVGDGNSDTVKSSTLFTVTVPETLPDDLLRKRAADREQAGLPAENKDNSNRYNQWFVITPNAGYYGDGYVEITVADGDGNVHNDSLSTTFRINVRVLYDRAEASNAFNPVKLARCKTASVDIGTLMPKLDNKIAIDENGMPIEDGAAQPFSQAEYYTLTEARLQNASDGAYATLERVGETGVWTVTAGNLVTIEGPVRVNIKYALNADPTKEYTGYFMLEVTDNAPPTLKYDKIDFVRYEHTGDPIRDLDEANAVRLEAWQLFGDADDPDGRALRFVSAESSVPSIVTATLTDDNRFLVISFAAKGAAVITVRVTDETGEPVELKFEANNADLPEGSLWLRVSAAFEANTLMWSLILAGILLFIILLIIIIAVSVKRKRAREELEALLVSEMELEEQMLKLAGGDPSAPGPYQSYGYLPPMPSSPAAADPASLLGAPTSAPNTDTPELAPPPANGESKENGDSNGDDN